jgi:hypothetical protein
MWRKFSLGFVTILGVLLFLWGGTAMWIGWDMIQIERGWSLFIAGAAALAGGSVTLALGLVLLRLDDILLETRLALPREPKTPSEAPPSAKRPAPKPTPPAPPSPPPAETLVEVPENIVAWQQPHPAPEAEPVEVDRYTADGVTYVMLSDGSVDVHSADGVRRYASLADLRAQAAQ